MFAQKPAIQRFLLASLGIDPQFPKLAVVDRGCALHRPERSKPEATILHDSLASKEAALRALGEIAGFFRRTEPHSPVAYLLERAVLWANMPLEQFLAELIRDESTLSSIRERIGLPPSY